MTTQKIIKPQTPKGFRDFLPEEAKARQEVVAVFRRIFEKYGYEPLEPPAVEYAETILGKYGDEADKMVFTFKDRGGRELALKYDMTVSACRVVAQYKDKLTFPFKRYQIQNAWRAEKPQRGRFREFLQCDADVWGVASSIADAEFIQMGVEIMLTLGFKDFRASINNRKVINGIAQFAGASEKQFYDVVVSVDKLKKIGLTGVKEELAQRKIDPQISEKVLSIVKLTGSSQELLRLLKNKLNKFPEAQEGLEELRQIFNYLAVCKIPEKFYQFDLSIIRGLAYYTGPVWEFEITEGKIGSVAGCGRYDKLTGMFTGLDIPATGGSFGIERIVQVMKERQMLKSQKTSSKILVTVFSPELFNQSLKIANELRNSGINTEIYLEPGERLDKQLKYADKKGIPYVMIIGPDEVKRGGFMVKDMEKKTQTFYTNLNESFDRFDKLTAGKLRTG